MESRGGQADRVEALAAAQLDCALKGRQEPSGTAHVRFHGAHGAGDLERNAVRARRRLVRPSSHSNLSSKKLPSVYYWWLDQFENLTNAIQATKML